MEQRKNTASTILLLAVLALILAGALLIYQSLTGNTNPSGGTTPSDDSQAFVDFTVTTMEGDSISLSDFVGTPIVVNFWASWCPPCKEELPYFDSLSQQYDGEIQFLMVNITDGARETVESASAFIEESGYTFPVYLDTEGSAQIAYYTYSLPTTVFFDAQGNQVARHIGMMSEEQLESYISMIH